MNLSCKTVKGWALSLIILFVASMLNAQPGSVTVTATVPGQLQVCEAGDIFTINISNPNPFTISNIEVLIEFPDGIEYQAGSLSGAGVAELNVSTLDSASFTLPDLNAAQTVQFQINANAYCPALFGTDSIFSNTVTAFHSGGVDSLESPAYNLQFGALNITAMSNDTASVGDTITRIITITNGGQGPINSFTFFDVHDTVTLKMVNFKTLPGNIPLNLQVYSDSFMVDVLSSAFTNVGNGDSVFNINEVIQICYNVVVMECLSTGSDLGVSWGCQGDLCQADVAFTDIVIPNFIPAVTAQHYYFENYCYGPGVQNVGKIVFSNNGPGPARDLIIDVSQSTGPTFASGQNLNSGYDLANISWKSSTGQSSLLTPFYVDASNPSCVPAGFESRFKVLIPLMQPGEQDTLIFYQEACCGSPCSDTRMLSSKYQFDYNDQCLTNQYSDGPYTLSYYWAVSDWITAFFHEGPTDLVSGDTALMTITHSRWRFATPKGANASFLLQMVFPPGISFTGNTNDVWLENYDGLVFTPNSITYSNDTVTAEYPLPFQLAIEKAELKIRLVASCPSGFNGSFTETIQYYVRTISEAGCWCIECAGSYSFEMRVHCPPPPCGAGGMISLGYENIRTSYGLPDFPDDGLPDPGNIDFSKVRTTHLMFGDTMYTRMHGVVETTSANPTWNWGYLNSYIQRGQSLIMLSDSVRIKDVSTGAVYNCALPAPNITAIGSDRNFQFDFSTATIAGCVPASYVFEQGDSVEVIAWYMSNRTGSFTQTNEIENTFYLTDAQNGTVYACDTFSGSFTYVGYYFTVCCGPNFHQGANCGLIATTESYYLSIGNCCVNYSGGNMFKNEYRPWAVPQTLYVIKPTGFNLDHAEFQYYRTKGTTKIQGYNSAFSPTGISGDTLIFDVGSFFAMNGGPLPTSDDGFNGWWRMWWEPTCNVPHNGWQPVHYALVYQTVPQLNQPGSYPIRRTRLDSIKYEAPRLDVQALPQTISVVSDTLTWDLFLQNTSNLSDAENSWLIAQPASTNLSVISLTETATGIPVPKVNNVFQVGTVNSASGTWYRLKVAYSACASDSIELFTGWNCAGYPVDLNDYPCTPEQYTLYLQEENTAYQSTVNSPATPLFLCDTIPVEITVLSSQLGSISDITVQVLLPITGGISMETGSNLFEYPANSGFTPISDPVFSGSGYTWEIDSISSFLSQNDLPGVSKPDSNSFKLQFKLRTDCQFFNLSSFVVKISGDKSCGESLSPVFSAAAPIDIVGAASPYNSDITATLDTIEGCQVPQTIRIKMVNLGPTSTNFTDKISMTLPPGMSYAGGFNGIHNPPPSPTPFNQPLLNGFQDVGWNLPAGIIPGDSVVLEANIQAGYTTVCNEQINIKSTTAVGVICVTTGFCIVASASGNDLINVVVRKPALSASALTASYSLTGGMVNLSLSGIINNSGSPVNSGNTTTMQLLCDVDQSATFSSGDQPLKSFLFTDSITSGSSLAFNKSFVLPGSVCPVSCNHSLIVAFLPDSAAGQCLCDTSAVAFFPTLAGSVSNDTVLCEKETASMSASGGTIYTWSPGLGLSDSTSANPVVTALGDQTYQVQIADSYNCVYLDSVFLETQALPVPDFSSVLNCNDHSVNFTDASTPGDTSISSWSWTFGDGGFGGLTSPAHLYAAAGAYNVQLITVDANGCRDTVIHQITEPGFLNSSILVANADCPDGLNGAINLSVSGGKNPFNFLWSNAASTEDIINLVPGSYFVTVTDSMGCVLMDSATIALGPVSGPAGVWTWIGQYNADWFNPCNWDKVEVPDTTKPVVIPGATLFNPTIDSAAGCQTININESNGAEVIVDGVNGGSLRVD